MILDAFALFGIVFLAFVWGYRLGVFAGEKESDALALKRLLWSHQRALSEVREAPERDERPQARDGVPREAFMASLPFFPPTGGK